MLKMHEEAHLDPQGITNKLGRMALNSRVTIYKGVPPCVGMKVTRHKSIGAYKRYNESMSEELRVVTLAIGGSN